MDNFLKYLVAIMGRQHNILNLSYYSSFHLLYQQSGTIAGLVILIFIFTACWCVKQRRLAGVSDSTATLYAAHRPIVTISQPFQQKEVMIYPNQNATLIRRGGVNLLYDHCSASKNSKPVDMERNHFYLVYFQFQRCSFLLKNIQAPK
jgi:hypothetical protein